MQDSITQGAELKAPCDPRVSLIQASDLPDRQIIGNLLDSLEEELFTLKIHSVHGFISSPSVLPRMRPHQCTQQPRKRNTQMEMSLSFSFSAPSGLLFISPFIVFLLHTWLTGDSISEDKNNGYMIVLKIV